MKKSSFSMFPIVVAGVCLAVFVMTANAIKIDHPKYNKGATNIVPGRYIISFSGKQHNAGSVFTQSIQDQFKDVDMKVNQRYIHDFFNGISVNLDTSDDTVHASALKTILDRSDVESVTPVRLIPRPKVITESKKKGEKSAPSVLPHAMTQVDLVHSKLKNKGKGVTVGVLDTGIDYLHPALGGGFGPGFKVTKGYDLVGDAYTGANAPKPDSDPLDACSAGSGASGHGTHVSGIIAGFDKATNFTGVAPEANLGMWRVFGCGGEASNDVILKALLMAYDAGVDVINLSLGETNSWGLSSSAESAVVNQIVAKGVHVIISAGNSGDQGIYTVGQPSTYTNGFSVASIENENNYLKVMDLTATGISHPISYKPSGNDAPKAGVVVNSDKNPGNTADSCTADQISPAVKGKIALTQRGTCSFVQKAQNAQDAGAVGIIIYNNVDGSLSASVPGVKIPTVTISNADGKELAAVIQKGIVSLTFRNYDSSSPNLEGGAVSYFSSVGAESELNLKPNIAGIGGHVYSTVPRYLGSYGVKSGTSMAAPYIAGSMALYIHSQGKNKKQSISYIHEQFQNYALPVKVYNSTAIDTPLRQGAGLVQLYDAITQKTHISPAQFSFNDTATTKYRTKTFTITNHGSKTISYELTNDVSTAISPYDFKASGYTPLEPPKNVKAVAKLRFSTKTFKLSAGQSKKITVTVTPPKTNPRDHVFYGGYIYVVSKQKSSGKDIKIPYFGVVGSQKTLPIFDNGFPTIIDLKSKRYGPKDTFTYDRNSTSTKPIAVLRILTPTKVIKADLLDAKTKKAIGTFQTGLNYVGRNFLVGDQKTSQYPWDGTYVPAAFKNAPPVPVPQGTYLLRYSALKLLGNPNDKKDWETWTSGPIVVKN